MGVGFEGDSACSGTLLSNAHTSNPLESILGMSAAPTVVAAGEYLTLDDLCNQVASQELAGSVAKARIKYMLEASAFKQAWLGLQQWLRESMETAATSTDNKTVRLASMACLSHRVYGMGIRVPSFALNGRFKRKYGLMQESLVEASGNVFGMHYLEFSGEKIVDQAGPSNGGVSLDADVALFAVESLIRAIGITGGSGAALRVNFGVGELLIVNRMAMFSFTQRTMADGPQRPLRRKHDQESFSSAVSAMESLSPRHRRHSEQQDVHNAMSPNARVLGRFVDIGATEIDEEWFNEEHEEDEEQQEQLLLMTKKKQQSNQGGPGLWSLGAASDLREYASTLESLTIVQERPGPKKKKKPLLDLHSRLRAATLSTTAVGVLALSSSAKIGAHYDDHSDYYCDDPVFTALHQPAAVTALSPRAQKVESASESRRRRREDRLQSSFTANSAPARPLDADEEEEPEEETYPVKEAALYAYYAGPRGVPSELVQEFDGRRLQKLLAKVASSRARQTPETDWPSKDALFNLLQAPNPNLLQEKQDMTAAERTASRLIAEILRRHVAGLSKAVLDYVLLNRGERTRLGLPLGVPGQVRVEPERRPPSLPRRWRAAVAHAKQSLACRLLLTTPPLVDCNSLWQREFSELNLLKPPVKAAPAPRTKGARGNSGGPRKPVKTPQTVADFLSGQLAHVEEIRERLHRDWHPVVGKAFFEALENGTVRLGGEGRYADERAYFNAAAQTMASQLHELAKRSLEEFLAHLETFDPDNEPRTNLHPPIFILKPGSNLSIGVAAVSLRAGMKSLISKAMTAFDSLERVEHWQRKKWDKMRPAPPRVALNKQSESGSSVGQPKNSIGCLLNVVTANQSVAGNNADGMTSVGGRRRLLSSALTSLGNHAQEQPSTNNRASARRPSASLNGSSGAINNARRGSRGSIASSNAAFSAAAKLAAANSKPQVVSPWAAQLAVKMAEAPILLFRESNLDYSASIEERLSRVVETNLKIAAANVELYRPFDFLLSSPKEPEAYSYGEDGSPAPLKDVASWLLELQDEIEALMRTAMAVADVSCGFASTPLVDLDVATLEFALVDEALKRVGALERRVCETISREAARTTSNAQKTCVLLRQKPTTIDELVRAQADHAHILTVAKVAFQSKHGDLQRMVNFLVSNAGLQGGSSDILEKTRLSHRALLELDTELEKGATMLAEAHASLGTEVSAQVLTIQGQLTEVTTTISALAEKGNPKFIRDYLESLKDARKRIAILTPEIADLHDRELKLGMTDHQLTRFHVDETNRSMEPYEELWQTALDFQNSFSTWVKGPIRALNGPTVQRDHAKLSKAFFDLGQRLASFQADEPSRFALSIHAQLVKFQPNIPILCALSSKNLLPEDWAEVSKLVGFEVHEGNITSLASFLKLSEDRPDKAQLIAAIEQRANDRKQNADNQTIAEGPSPAQPEAA